MRDACRPGFTGAIRDISLQQEMFKYVAVQMFFFPPRTVLLENQFQSLNYVAFCRLLLHLVGIDLK